MFKKACQMYARECEKAGVIHSEPSHMDDEDFQKSLKLENTHGTLARFALDGTSLHFAGFGDE